MTPTTTYDVIIVGGGPAGYAAALYAARASLSTLILEHGMAGGQIATSDSIDNYPGIPMLSGAELGMRMQEHADSAGAISAYGSVSSIVRDADGMFHVTTDMEAYHAPAVIVATGATPREAGFTNEASYRGRGVSYCATCDGMFYRGKKVFVLGSGNSACEEALYLARIADEVEMIVRRDQFRAPRGMVQRVLDQENIKIRYQSTIDGVYGDGPIDRIAFKDTATDEVYEETFEPGSIGVFVFAGMNPATDLVADLVELDDSGAVVTDDRMATSTPGLYCAGDMRAKSLRQVVTAVSDGAIAAMSAYHYLDARG